MALPIITAIRTRRDLKQSLKDTAEELAHLASIYGVARAALTFLPGSVIAASRRLSTTSKNWKSGASFETQDPGERLSLLRDEHLHVHHPMEEDHCTNV